MKPNRKIEFGINDYKVPKINFLKDNAKLTTLPKAQRKNFADLMSQFK